MTVGMKTTVRAGGVSAIHAMDRHPGDTPEAPL